MARPKSVPVTALEEQKNHEESVPVTALEEGLILVVKDGEEIKIHPDAEADHKRLGWVRV